MSLRRWLLRRAVGRRRLTPHGRRLLVERAQPGHRIAHVAKAMGVSRQCAHRWINRFNEAAAGPMPRREVAFDDSYFDSFAAQVASEGDGFGRPSHTDVLSLAIMPLMDVLAEEYEGNTMQVRRDELFRVLVQTSNVVERIRLWVYELSDVVYVVVGRDAAIWREPRRAGAGVMRPKREAITSIVHARMESCR